VRTYQINAFEDTDVILYAANKLNLVRASFDAVMRCAGASFKTIPKMKFLKRK
jgi:DNA polymerase-4